MILYPLVFLLSLVLAWGCNQLELIRWRRAADLHWTEQARRLFPARVARSNNLWLIPGCLTLAGYCFSPESSWIAAAVCGLLGALLGNFPMDRETHPGLTFGPWAHQVFANLLLHASTLATYGIAAVLMPDHFDWTVAVIAAVLLGLQLGIQFGWGIRLMRALRMLKPASPRLQALVDETSAAMGIRVRHVWEMVGASANAVAFVVTNDLGFTRKILEICPDEELKAICAHELGHLSESRWALALRLAGALALFPLVFFRPVWGQWEEFSFAKELSILGLILLPTLILAARARLARAMETRADKIARENIAEAPVYARALERLYRSSLLPAVRGKGSSRSHPDLYDRMLAAGLTPDYARPKPPYDRRWTSVVLIVIAIALFLYVNTGGEWPGD